MASRHEHTPEQKAQVIAALLAGQSVSAIARQFKVDRTTVHRWRAAAGLNGTTLLQQEKRGEIDDLVGNLLRTIIETLQIQAQQCQDKEWIKRQPASELAVFFGVLADKAFRILEAADASGGDMPSPVP